MYLIFNSSFNIGFYKKFACKLKLFRIKKKTHFNQALTEKEKAN